MIPGLERFPGVGNGNRLQYSCLENSIDRRAWWAIVHEAAKSQTQLNTHTHTHTLIYYMPGTILPGSTGLSLYLLSSLSEFNLNQGFSNRPSLNYKLGHTVPYKLSEYFTFTALQPYLIICFMFITSNLHIYVFGNFWIKKRVF